MFRHMLRPRAPRAAEVVGTFIATFVVLEVACNPRSKVGNLAPAIVGATFGTLLIVLSPFSSGSFNPARSLGPAAISKYGKHLWVFVFAPVVGALLAVPIHLSLVVRLPAPVCVCAALALEHRPPVCAGLFAAQPTAARHAILHSVLDHVMISALARTDRAIAPPRRRGSRAPRD
jgi:Major intrinsic protein